MKSKGHVLLSTTSIFISMNIETGKIRFEIFKSNRAQFPLKHIKGNTHGQAKSLRLVKHTIFLLIL